MSNEYDMLHDYMENISDNFSVRVYSDKTVNVSGYIGKEHISLEGSYTIVLKCIQHMYWERNDED